MKVEHIGDDWVTLRIGPFYGASSPTHYWFRLYGRGLAALHDDGFKTLSERYAGQGVFPKIKWVRFGAWRIRWIGAPKKVEAGRR